VSSRRVRLERLADSGHEGARAALILANDPGRFLASLQFGITSVAILTGTFSSLLKNPRLGEAVVIQFSVTNRRRLACGAHL
jgi:putative hemolysin